MSRLGRIRAACLAAALAALICAAGPTAAALGATAAQTIAELNAQRAANGLPAGITEDPALSSGCAAHDHYMAVNHTLTHYEVAGNHEYTAAGANAGKNAVLTQGGNWDAGNPYESAPLHLDQLLAPRLLSTGTADAEGFSCTTTFPGWNRPAPAVSTVYTYPGNGATIYPSEVAREGPWTPGDLVGLPQPTRTGPYLIVLVDAPGQMPFDNPAGLSGATLTGPSGAVAVKTVDGNTPVPGGPPATLGAYLSPGGFIIPVSPLQPGASYHASVVVSFGGQSTLHEWSFTVQRTDPQSSLTAQGMVLHYSSHSPAAAQLSFTRPGGQRAPALTIAPGHRVRVRLSPGSWQACAIQPPSGRFAGSEKCLELIVTGRPRLAFASHHVSGRQIRFALSFSAVLRGRAATLTVIPITVHCGGRSCTTSAGHAARRTIILGAGTVHLPLPARHHGFRLSLHTRAFLLADAPWTAAQAATRYVR